MQKVTLTEAEEKLFLLIKKKQLQYKECRKFLELFYICLKYNLFICQGGEKILRFDGDGNLRRIETHIPKNRFNKEKIDKIDWKL